MGPEGFQCHDLSQAEKIPTTDLFAIKIKPGDSPWELGKIIFNNGNRNNKIRFVSVQNGVIKRSIPPDEIRAGHYALVPLEAKKNVQSRKIALIQQESENPLSNNSAQRLLSLSTICIPEVMTKKANDLGIDLGLPDDFWNDFERKRMLSYVQFSENGLTPQEARVYRKESQEDAYGYLRNYISTLSGEDFHTIPGLLNQKGKMRNQSLVMLLYGDKRVPRYQEMTLPSERQEGLNKLVKIYNIPPKILAGIIMRESKGDPIAISGSYALGGSGLTQNIIFGRWGAEHTWQNRNPINPFNREESDIRMAEYLSYLYTLFRKDYSAEEEVLIDKMVTTAYNIGRNGVIRAIEAAKRAKNNISDFPQFIEKSGGNAEGKTYYADIQIAYQSLKEQS